MKSSRSYNGDSLWLIFSGGNHDSDITMKKNMEILLVYLSDYLYQVISI